MEFRMLGPLEVSHRGRPIRIRGRHHPKVLALLLAEAGRVVGAGRLIDLLWGAEPPQTATRQIQNIVAGLRRQLGDDAPPLEAVGAGYRFQVEPDRLDSAMFDARVREASRLARDGEPGAALECLTAGLALWRGRALADLSEDGLASIVDRLEESRLAAFESQVDMAVELGRGAEFIASLREALDANPYRERLASRLMLVLHHDSRTAEALDVFATVRSRLMEDLGTSPSRELSQTHSEILRGEPRAGRGPAGRSTSDGAPNNGAAEATVPAQLPFIGARFVGRDAELERLDELVDEGPEVVVVSGPGGIGKTALVLRWAEANRQHFRDGQLYVNLGGFGRAEPVTAQAALQGFLRALGVPQASIPDSVSEASAAFRSELADKRFLIVLDNARDAEQVRPLLPGSGRNRVLITSRNRLTGLVAVEGAGSMPLRPLSSVESMMLVRRLIGSDRFLRERVSADRLADLCGHLPLALRIAAANLAARPGEKVSEFVEEFESQGRLELLAVDGDPDATVASAFESSYLSLSELGRRVFVWMGAMPGEYFCAAQLAAVAGITRSDARRAIVELNQAHLVEPYRDSWHRMHDLVRLYARQKAEEETGDADRESICLRLYDWFVADYRSRMDPVDFENLVSAFWHYRHRMDVWRLCGAFKGALNVGIGSSESRRCAAEGVKLATERGDPLLQAHMWDLWSMTLWASARYSEAIGAIEKSIRFAEESNDDYARRLGASAMGLLLYNEGRFLEAEPYVRRALELLGPDGPAGPRANATNRLSGINRGLGRYEEAIAHARTSMELVAGTWFADSVARLSLAKALSDKGDLEEALRELDLALTTVMEVYGPRDEELIQSERSEVLRRLGRPSEALDVLRWLERKHARGTWGARMRWFIDENLPLTLVDLGRVDEALQHIRGVADGAGDHTLGPASGVALSTAVVLNSAGQYAEALEAATRAHDSYRAQAAPLRQARSLAAMAVAHRGLGHWREATRLRAEADALFRRIGAAEVATDTGSAVSGVDRRASEASTGSAAAPYRLSRTASGPPRRH